MPVLAKWVGCAAKSLRLDIIVQKSLIQRLLAGPIEDCLWRCMCNMGV